MVPAPEDDAGADPSLHPRGPDRRAVRTPVNVPPAEGVRGAVVGLSPGSSLHYLVTGATLLMVIAALYFGRQILIPLALGTLLAFTLQPLVTRLRRLGLGRVGSVTGVTGLATALLLAFVYVTGSQVVTLANNLPSYKSNLEEKIRFLKSSAASGSALDKASVALRDLNRQINAAGPADPLAAPGKSKRQDPVPVQVVGADAGPLQVAADLLGRSLEPAALIGLVFIFMVFILLEHEHLRDRLIRLMGGGDMNLTTEAMSEAGDRVSRYLALQVLVNASFGVPIGIGLYFIGVPNAVLWGVLATVLRFVPYVGPFIAALFPAVMAVAVDPGWSMLGWTLALFAVSEVVNNNIVKPLLYTSSTGMSAIAMIAAAVFWTTLWGPAGLFLSTPLTVCLVVLGRYVPQLHFLYLLLGNAPALTPPERFYQRMLAGDALEGAEIGVEYAANHGIQRFHEDVALVALQLAEADRRRAVLSTERAEAVSSTMREVFSRIQDFQDPRPAIERATGDEGDNGDGRSVLWGEAAVLCVGARTPLDTALAALLAQALQYGGIDAWATPAASLAGDGIKQVGSSLELIVLAQLSDSGGIHVQQLCRRLRKHSGARLLLTILEPPEVERGPESVVQDVADGLVRSFDEALQWTDERARTSIEAPMTLAPLALREDERLEALARTGLLDTPAEDVFDQMTQELKEAFDAPIALLSLIDADRQFWKSTAGLPAQLCETRESPRATSICGHVVAANKVLVAEDTWRDARFANNPLLREQGIRFYAGAPLRSRDGLAIGSLCVMDVRPRKITKAEEALLVLSAQLVMNEIESRGDAAFADPQLVSG
jgi:predicted PurR-regulated permease PerM